MTISSVINLMAGLMIMISLFLADASGTLDMTEPSWLWLTAFVGFNLFQFAFTGFCPLDKILRKMGLKDVAETACNGGGCAPR